MRQHSMAQIRAASEIIHRRWPEVLSGALTSEQLARDIRDKIGLAKLCKTTVLNWAYIAGLPQVPRGLPTSARKAYLQKKVQESAAAAASGAGAQIATADGSLFSASADDLRILRGGVETLCSGVGALCEGAKDLAPVSAALQSIHAKLVAIEGHTYASASAENVKEIQQDVRELGDKLDRHTELLAQIADSTAAMVRAWNGGAR